MKTVTLIGAGGNIGSHLVPHLARMEGIGRVILVDRDTYEHNNLSSQDILPSHIGKPKAHVQARRLRRINPSLDVCSVVGSVEDMPIGRLRADVMLTALDSRRSRQCVNEIAWRLGVPWCDSGVRPEELLARIAVYIPGEDAPCMECAWSDSDYAQIEQTYPCQASANSAEIPTNAPSCLGALAAAMQGLECRKILEGQFDRLAAGRQVVIDAQWHRHYVTRYRRNPECRFDHKSWIIDRLHCRLDRFALEDALRLGDRIELDRMPFLSRLTCSGCGLARSLLFLAPALSPTARSCAACGAAMTANGFGILEMIDSRQPQQILRRSLRDVGLRRGDVFHAGNGKYFEIACDES